MFVLGKRGATNALIWARGPQSLKKGHERPLGRRGHLEGRSWPFVGREKKGYEGPLGVRGRMTGPRTPFQTATTAAWAFVAVWVGHGLAG